LITQLNEVWTKYLGHSIYDRCMHQMQRDGVHPPARARRLDQVRVVSINQPVRLYELLEEKSHSTPAMEEALEIFTRGQDLFEARKWQEAQGYFERVMKLLPEDGPSQLYIKRCRKFAKKEPPEDWDGVFNLSLK